MKLKRAEFLSILESIKPGITAKEVMEGMDYFFFSGTDLITYNDKISIQHPFKTDFTLFVKAGDLYKLISKLTVDEIELIEKGDKLHISCKTMKANLATITNDEVSSRISSVAKSLKSAKWKDLPSNFASSIQLCSYTASKLESDRTLTCVYITNDDCVASDNNRIAHAKLESKMDELFIKASEIKNLTAIGPVKYAVTGSWSHFKNENDCVFSIRRVTGQFPDFVPFFDFKGTSVKLPTNILEGVDIASVLVSDSTPAVQLKIVNGFCHVSINAESGTMMYRSKIDYDGKEILFTINPEFLKEMMSHSSTITMGEDRAKLDTGDKNFSMVTALYG